MSLTDLLCEGEAGAAELNISLHNGDITVLHSNGSLLLRLEDVPSGTWNRIISLLTTLPAKRRYGEMVSEAGMTESGNLEGTRPGYIMKAFSPEQIQALYDALSNKDSLTSEEEYAQELLKKAGASDALERL